MNAEAKAARNVEGKYRTGDTTKKRASEIYANWGLSLSDAITVFLEKSIDVGGPPFDMRLEKPSFDSLAAQAYKPPLNAEGVAVLPADWDDESENPDTVSVSLGCN